MSDFIAVLDGSDRMGWAFFNQSGCTMPIAGDIHHFSTRDSAIAAQRLHASSLRWMSREEANAKADRVVAAFLAKGK